MIQKNIKPRASNPPLCKEVISEKNSNNFFYKNKYLKFFTQTN